MHIAYIGPTLSGSGNTAPGSLDARFLQELVDVGHQVHCVLDHDGYGADEARDAGVTVSISPKRMVPQPEGRTLWADEMQADLLSHVHEADAVDLIVYGSDFPVDLSWHQPILGRVPTAVLMCSGSARDVAPVTGHAELARTYGRRLWALTSLWATMDLMLATHDPTGYGLLPEHLPQWQRVGPETTAYDGRTAATVVVFATTVDAARAQSLVDRLCATNVITPSTTVITVFNDLAVATTTMREIILDGCPPHLRAQLVLLPLHEGELVREFLQVADLVWIESPADFTAMGLARPGAPVHALFEESRIEPTGDWTQLAVDRHPRVLTVEVDGAAAGARAELEALLWDPEGPEVAVLHAPAFTQQAVRLAGFGRLHRADMAMLSCPDQVFGGPDPEVLNRWVLAAHRRVWPSLLRRMGRTGTLSDLVDDVSDLRLMSRARLVVLPDSACGTSPVRQLVGGAVPAWSDDHGVLPRPELVHRGADRSRPPSRLLDLNAVRRLRRSRMAAEVRRRFPDEMRRARLFLEGRS